MTERAKFTKEGNKRELYRFPHMGMWTKLRPGIWNFLARVKRPHLMAVFAANTKIQFTGICKSLPDPYCHCTFFVG